MKHNGGQNPVNQSHGSVTIFTGDGRGKTSAAIGTAIRAAGHGLRTFIAFFMKGNMYAHGEMLALKEFPSIQYRTFGQDSWIIGERLKPEHFTQATAGLSAVRDTLKKGEHDLIIMDEVNVAIDLGLLSADEVLCAVNSRPAGTEIILTGRNADQRLIDAADTVTEMRCVKHGYNIGIPARKGIDY